jgi:metal-sulfur cluster biosynthetic enzyme
MDEQMKNKLTHLLNTVKEPHSGLTLNQLGIIEGIKYDSLTNKLIVVTDPDTTSKACCMIFDLYKVGELEDMIASVFMREFPGMKIEFACKKV